MAPPVKPVPLAWDAWRYLAFHRNPKPVGRSVPIPPEGPPTLLPGYRLEPDTRIFLSVLARLPEVRQPWLRAIYERGRPYDYSHYDEPATTERGRRCGLRYLPLLGGEHAGWKRHERPRKHRAGEGGRPLWWFIAPAWLPFRLLRRPSIDWVSGS